MNVADGWGGGGQGKEGARGEGVGFFQKARDKVQGQGRGPVVVIFSKVSGLGLDAALCYRWVPSSF